MAIRQNTPKFVLPEPPEVGKLVSCGKKHNDALIAANSQRDTAEDAASKAKTIRDAAYTADEEPKKAACNQIAVQKNPRPCVDGNLNITGYSDTPNGCKGSSKLASDVDLKNMSDICHAALQVKREEYNLKSTAQLDADWHVAYTVWRAAYDAANNALDACCKANKNSEGCNPKTPTTV